MSSSHDPRHGQVLSESFLWIILFVKVKLWFLFGKVLEKLKKKNTSKTFPPTKGGVVSMLFSPWSHRWWTMMVPASWNTRCSRWGPGWGSGWNHLHGGRMIPGLGWTDWIGPLGWVPGRYFGLSPWIPHEKTLSKWAIHTGVHTIHK